MEKKSILQYMKPIIFIDMDGTINKFWEAYTAIYNEIYQDHKFLKPSDLYSYSVAECLLGKENDDLDRAIMSKRDFWLNIPVQDGAFDVIERMYDQYDCYILSTPWNGYPDCVRDKMMWMDSKFPFFSTKKMIFTHHKNLLKGNVLIDDHPKNINGFEGLTATIDFPYNHDADVDFRTSSWYEIESWLQEVL
mgnify:CR=1 FL=1